MIPWCWSQWFCRTAGTRSAKRVLARCNKTQLPAIVPFVKSPYGVPHNWRQTSLWKSWWRRFRWKTQRETRVGASKWSHSTIRPNAFMSCRIGAASEVGVVELFFSNAVQLTIIPQWIFPLTVVSVTLIWFPAQQDTNDLTKTKMALGGFCWSVFNFKQMTVDILQAGNTAEPTASGV